MLLRCNRKRQGCWPCLDIYKSPCFDIYKSLYAPDADARESSDDSEDMTPQPLEDDSGVDAIDGAGEDTDIVGGGFMGEGDYAVEEFSIQQRIMHFLGQRIDKQNRFNVEICLLL